MSFLEDLKKLFGFTPVVSGSQPDTRKVSQNRTNTQADKQDDVPLEESVTPAELRVPVAKSAPSGPPPASTLREQLLRFIVGKLRAYQNEPDTAPVGIRLCILTANPEEEELYRVALWTGQAGKFQNELNRLLADNYINLPAGWRFESAFFRDALPDCTYREGTIGLIVLDKSRPDGPPQLARVVALVGQTEQAEYVLDPAQKTTYCIGRGHRTQTTSGRVRTNDIVILNDDDAGFDAKQGNGNGAVSRAHATIRYDVAQRRYSLLVDPGGLPGSGNKTKIMHPDDTIERADIGGMNYPLQDGDQIELGGEVMLLFELKN